MRHLNALAGLSDKQLTAAVLTRGQIEKFQKRLWVCLHPSLSNFSQDALRALYLPSKKTFYETGCLLWQQDASIWAA